MPITLSIKTGAIDKAKLKVGRNGEHYLEMVLIETPNSKFDQDFMVVQSVSKEERDRGVKGNILGNGKILGRKPAPKPTSAPAESEAKPSPEDDPDVPF